MPSVTGTSRPPISSTPKISVFVPLKPKRTLRCVELRALNCSARWMTQGSAAAMAANNAIANRKWTSFSSA